LKEEYIYTYKLIILPKGNNVDGFVLTEVAMVIRTYILKKSKATDKMLKALWSSLKRKFTAHCRKFEQDPTVHTVNWPVEY